METEYERSHILTGHSDPAERPTAETLLRSPFCFSDPNYNFLDTELYAKIRGAFGVHGSGSGS